MIVILAASTKLSTKLSTIISPSFLAYQTTTTTVEIEGITSVGSSNNRTFERMNIHRIILFSLNLLKTVIQLVGAMFW